jgi:hypothetical protein
MSEDEEVMPEFNKKHYPKGVNADFYNVDRKPNEEMLKLFKGRLEDPENRDIAREKGKLISLLQTTCGLTSGNVVVDLGSGSGILIEDVLSIIRDDERKGRLIATEISEFFVDHLETMRKEKGWEDVLDIVYSPDPKDPKLDTYNGTVDFVFVIDVYHHIEFPHTVMKSKCDANLTTTHILQEFLPNYSLPYNAYLFLTSLL